MITIYGRAGCGYCTKAKDLLIQHDIDFTEVRIDENDEAKAFVLSEGHKTVPQLYVNGTLLVENGYTGLAAIPKLLLESRINELKRIT
jgi:glutaredoxin